MITLSPAFDPLPALVGGASLGATCVLRVALRQRLSGLDVRSFFLPGMAIGGLIAGLQAEDSFDAAPIVDLTFIASALLVGVGVSLGKGCTCGNGIQGLGMLSIAGFVNVCSFMGAAAAVANLMPSGIPSEGQGIGKGHSSTAPGAHPWRLVVGCAVCMILMVLCKSQPILVDLGAGTAFALALTLSGMVRPSKVLGFLTPLDPQGWDPSLAFVMGGAVMVALPLFSTAVTARPHIQKWAARPVDLGTVLGGICFGAGWGGSGCCPCPAVTGVGASVAHVLTGDGSVATQTSLYATLAFATTMGVSFITTEKILGAASMKKAN